MPKESLASKRERTVMVLNLLKKEYPFSKCSLNFKNPLELLVATMLSAQCTDERVNKVTQDLFKKYICAQDYASVPLIELEQDIKSTGFYRNKAKNIQTMARQLLECHNGKVPPVMDDLIKLAGVGRKTANVVLHHAFGIVEGVVVDTHVTRIANLLKLTNHHDAVKIENDLIKLIPQSDWPLFTHLIIDHGRAVCIARRPQCQVCVLNKLCPSSIV